MLMPTIFSDRDDQQRAGKLCKVQKAKPRLLKQIPTRDADWFKSHLRKFYSSADLPKISFLSP